MKRMKMGNGYGSISYLGKGRRRPYVVRITTDWEISKDGKVKQIRKILGYTQTRAQALELLVSYNKNPYNLDNRKKTFEEVYEEWKQEKFPTISKSGINSYNASFTICKELHNRYFSELKHHDFQNVIDTCGKNYPTLRKVKIMLNQIAKFAIKNEFCDVDKTLNIDVLKYKDRNPNQLTRTKFSKEEIETLWKYSDNKNIKTILILIYTGLRVSEFYNIKNSDVDLEKKYLKVTESKTENGIRVVPIANKIYPFIEEFYSNHHEYLFRNSNDEKLTDHNYRDTYWFPAMKELNMNHRPHDTRHTCISLLAKAKIDDTTIKKIVGHKGTQSLTQRIYTHLDIEELLEAINKI